MRNNFQTYYLKGTTQEGCQGFDTINIKVFAKADIYIPNSFTPNRDGLNDYLRPICVGIRQFKYFRIYDRYGNLVFNSGTEWGKWDGTFKGQDVPNGNYVWMAEAIRYDGVLMQKKGSVMVLR